MDIAHELNVSKTLVSLVLNGKGDAGSISKDTQKKVITKAKELNYKPNQVARGLRMGTTKTIGLLVADISNPFFGRITRTIEHYADQEGYNLIVCSSDEDPEREKKLIRMLVNRQVDGVIMTSTAENPVQIDQLLAQNIPLVLIDRFYPELSCNYVGVNNLNSTQHAIDQLIEQGHQNIAFITLTPGYISPLRDRKQGYLNALNEHDIAFHPEYVLEVDYHELKNKEYQLIRDFLLEHPEITAVFTTNNSLAVGCLEVVRELGLTIPKDISLITFDDVELFKYTSPALSSIAQPVELIGKRAVSILLTQLKTGTFEYIHEEFETIFTKRESLGV